MSEREQQPTDVGAGLPEDGLPGTGIDPRQHAENEIPCEHDAGAGAREDSDPGTATGNPRAAGGDGESSPGDRD